jgi:hypothetical protein
MAVLKIFSAIAALAASPGIFFMFNTAHFRASRLKVLLGNPIQEFNLKNAPYVLKESFRSNLHNSIASSHGVKILWSPPGAGKSTTVRRILIDMKKINKIRGAIIVSPPDSLDSSPSTWFRNALRDAFGNLLHPNEKLSKLLPQSDSPPYVFVLDQIDNVLLGEDMRVFIKTLAEDSSFTKSYVVLVLTADASNARTMWDWNGREKIVLMNDLNGESPMIYRWDPDDIEEWLRKHVVLNKDSPLQEGTALRKLVKEAATIAGTPGFLRESVQLVETIKYDGLKRRALFKSEQWEVGANELNIYKT